MNVRPSDEISTAFLDALLEIAGDGSADLAQLQTTAVKREVFANVALHRWLTDHPGHGELTEVERYNAIEEGLAALAAEAAGWLLAEGYITAAAGDNQVKLGKPFKIGNKAYAIGTHREEDLFHSIRRVSPKRKQLIEESIASLGDLRHIFPVLEDDEGNVVDGRHRRAIDPEWPASPIKVSQDERLAAAVAANRGNAWDKDDWERLRTHQRFSSSAQSASLKLAELALQENPDRSDREIARLIGASHHTVAKARELGNLPNSKGTAGRPEGVDETKPRKKVVKLTDEQLQKLDSEIERRLRIGEPVKAGELATQYGVGRNYVQRRSDVVKSRLAQEDPLQQWAPAPEAEGQAGDQVIHAHHLIYETLLRTVKRGKCDDCHEVVTEEVLEEVQMEA